MTLQTISDYKDVELQGYGEHVGTVVVDWNKNVETWREKLTDTHLDQLKVESRSNVMMSLATSRTQTDILRSNTRFPQISLMGLERADPPKYPNADFSLFSGKRDLEEGWIECALRELKEESTIQLDKRFIEDMEQQRSLREKMEIPNFPLEHMPPVAGQ